MKPLNMFLRKSLRTSRVGLTAVPPFSVILGFALLIGASAAMAATISGTVTNRTTNKPSAGDEVALIGLQQGMQVVGHTTTDARGRYTLDVSDASPMHLVRVTHEKANYFRPVPPGTQTMDVDVYNAAEKVQGVSTEADVVRVEASPNGLSVIENYFVKNASSPPMTQFGMRAYEIYLPKEAKIVSSAALGPGSMPVQSAPVPLGTPGDYSFVFPLRPGETRFQVSYRLPYSGSFHFQPRFAAPVDNYAIILPKSMQFKGLPAAAFQSIDEDVKVQTYLTKNVTPQTKLAFQVSGIGLLPKETTVGSNGQNGNANAGTAASAENPEKAAQSAAENDTRPGIGLGVPIDTPDPLHKYQWWIVSLVVVLLAVGTGVSMRRKSPVPNPATLPSGGAVLAGNASPQEARPPVGPMQSPAPSATPSGEENSRPMLLEALKEELFALESERLEGRLSSEEYERQKNALEIVLKRALLRGTANGTVEST